MTVVAFLGDSITAGWATDDHATKCYPTLMGARLGWTIHNVGLAGTGYLAGTATGIQYSSAGRLADVLSAAPDVVIVQSSWNDLNEDINALPAAVAAVLAGLVSVPVVYVTSPPNGAGLPDPYISAARVAPLTAAIAPVAAQFGRPFISMQTPRQWFTGTGYPGALAGDGNCDLYMSADGGHPSNAGHAYLAACLAFAIRPPDTGLVEL